MESALRQPEPIEIEHVVEPGTFSHDRKRSTGSLAKLHAFVAAHPEIDVRLGHQP